MFIHQTMKFFRERVSQRKEDNLVSFKRTLSHVEAVIVLITGKDTTKSYRRYISKQSKHLLITRANNN